MRGVGRGILRGVGLSRSATAAVPVTVVSAVDNGDETATFTFSEAVIPGAVPDFAFQFQESGLWWECVSVVQSGPNALIVGFNGPVFAGEAWRILASVTSIDPVRVGAVVSPDEGIFT